jgi:ABC-type Fe3+-hydroxamate transport system substrate-binding protein
MKTKVIALVVVAILVVAGIGAVLIFTKNEEKNDAIALTSVALEVYGNADGDSDVDINDANLLSDYLGKVGHVSDADLLNFTEVNHFNKKFADANNDGTIDNADLAQVQVIVDGTAQTLWLLDGLKNERSVKRDISRIGAEYYANTELCLILGQADKVVAVDNAPYIYRGFYFNSTQQSNLVNMINMNTPDYSFINDLNLDILLTFYTNGYDVKQTKIIGTDVFYLGLYNPDMSNAEGSNFIQGILKAGYIFGAVERAEAYASWILETRNSLAEIASTIPEDLKPTVLMSNFPNSYFFNPDTKTASVYCYTDPLGQACLLGGGKNVAATLYSDYNTSLSKTTQVDALFNDDNATTIDYIFLHNVKYTFGGTVVAGVPDHGYLAANDAEMAAAWANATSSSHTLLVDLNPNHLYLIAGDFRNGPSGAVLLGAYIGKMINPTYYANVDPIAIHNYYINHWLGIEDFDVSVDGEFIYHSLE